MQFYTSVSLITFSNVSISTWVNIASSPLLTASFVVVTIVFKKWVEPLMTDFNAFKASGRSSCSFTLLYKGPVKLLICVNLSSYISASASKPSSSSQFDSLIRNYKLFLNTLKQWAKKLITKWNNQTYLTTSLGNAFLFLVCRSSLILFKV